MTPEFAVAIDRVPPGDRAVLLRRLDAHHTAARDTILAKGPVTGAATKGMLTRHKRTLGKVRALASRHGVRLDRATAEVAQVHLDDEQRRLLITALGNPDACRILAAAAGRYLAGVDQVVHRHG